ncbi:MAG: DUF1616 domain-containing protein [Dehalococcoidia bacterium]|nr:DUF1616 domain-containing protein [Dehalococcoidia bacterium]
MKTRRDKDLWLIDILAILLILVITFFPISVARIIIGIPLVLFFPGYTLVAALFPRRGDLRGVERIALSFGLSIAVASLIGFILNYTPWGVRLYPILISLTVFILAMSGVAWRRRKRFVEEDRFQVSFDIRFFLWKGQGGIERVLSIILTLAIAAAVGALAYVIATPRTGERFSEFYILGPQGEAVGYPGNLRLGEKGEIVLGIVNREQEEMDYQVTVVIDGGVEGVTTWTKDEDGELTLIAGNTIDVEGLAHEEKWKRRLVFEPLRRGEGQKLEFLLFSSKLRGGHHIRSQLGSGNFVDIEVDEADGRGKIALDNKSSAPYDYKLEIWQGGAIQQELSLSVGGYEKLEEGISFPAGKSIFQLYEDDTLALKDSGAGLSVHLWLDVS